MTDRNLRRQSLRRRFLHFCAAVSLLGLAALPLPGALAAGPEVLPRSDSPLTLEGEGDREFLVDGPFRLEWESPGGPFAIKAIAEGPPAKPVAGATTVGKAYGGFKAREEGRYKVSIMASGPWTATLTW